MPNDDARPPLEGSAGTSLNAVIDVPIVTDQSETLKPSNPGAEQGTAWDKIVSGTFLCPKCNSAAVADVQGMHCDCGWIADEPAESWKRICLADTVAGLRDGTLVRPRATLGVRSDGRGLFYPGRVNGLYGDSTAGKTWTALLCCTQAMESGGTVIFIDFEDDEVGTVERLLDLGVEPDAITTQFGYVRPDERFDNEARARLLQQIEDLAPTLVVIDSTGESMAMDGTKPNDDDDVARWITNLPKWVARLGPAVLLLDHLAKAGEKKTPVGSHRKLSAINGSAYVQASVKAFSKTQAGFSKLTCSKDRRGGWATGSPVAELHVEPCQDTGTLQVKLQVPDGAEREGLASALRQMEKMQAIADVLAANTDGLSKTRVRVHVKGGSKDIDAALTALIVEGYVSSETPHRLLRPYSSIERSEDA